jgi:hypothetical protein
VIETLKTVVNININHQQKKKKKKKKPQETESRLWNFISICNRFKITTLNNSQDLINNSHHHIGVQCHIHKRS